MNKKLVPSSAIVISSLLLSTFSIPAAYANDSYREEVFLQWFEADSDNYEADGFTLSGHFYFSPVDTRDHPLAEAVFLERKGHVSLLGFKSDSKSAITESDTDGGVIQAVYLNAASPFMATVGYQSSNTEYEFTSPYDVDIKGYDISLGYFLTRSFLVELSYEELDTEYNTILPIEDEETVSKEISVKYVNKLGLGTAINIEAGVQNNEYDDQLIEEKDRESWFESDYYFTHAFSTGVTFKRQSGDIISFEGDTAGVRSRLFITPQYAINIEYNKFSADDATVEDSKTYMVGVSGRF